MARLLYLKASPRGDRSHSVSVADAFVESYRQTHPRDEVVVVDVFKENLPVFDGFALQAKYAILGGKDKTPEEVQAWKAVEAVIEKFKSADKYVIAAPMWNFGIPYRLKQYIDVLVQPAYTFSYDPVKGYTGLVTGKPLTLILARGGEYDGGPYDMQKAYLELIAGFIGFTNIRSIVIQPTLGGADIAAQKRKAAIEEARVMAKTF